MYVDLQISSFGQVIRKRTCVHICVLTDLDLVVQLSLHKLRFEMKSVVTENVTYYLTMKFDDFNQHKCAGKTEGERDDCPAWVRLAP